MSNMAAGIPIGYSAGLASGIPIGTSAGDKKARQEIEQNIRSYLQEQNITLQKRTGHTVDPEVFIRHVIGDLQAKQQKTNKMVLMGLLVGLLGLGIFLAIYFLR